MSTTDLEQRYAETIEGMAAEELIEAGTAARIIAIAESLMRLPYSRRMMVFGSMAAHKENPGDIDIFLDCRGTAGSAADKRDQLSGYAELIRISRKHYGSVDPFLIFDDCLLVRNDLATGWVRARNAKSLLKQMEKHGKQLASVVDHYVQRRYRQYEQAQRAS